MRYLIGFLLSIGLIILIVVLLLSGGGSSKQPDGAKRLEQYAANGTQAVLTIDGPINADSQHQAVRISVDSQQVQYQQINGYDGSVANQQTYPNTENANLNFLFAVGRVGYLEGNTSSSLSDERGYCPLGDRYTFELINGPDVIERFWATSCGSTHTYNGQVGLTLQLFKMQVPNYNQLTQGLNI